MGSPRRTVLRSTLIVALAATLGLTACQTTSSHGTSADAAEVNLPPLTELTPVDDPSAFEGPSTAVFGGPSIDPVAENPEPTLPVTVTSHDNTGDTEIEITDTSRVIALSLSGSLAELVRSYGLADSLVGRDVSTNFEGAEDLPLVTREGHSIDAESVIGLQPTLIITDGSIGPTDVVLQLRDAGIPVVTVDRAVDEEATYETARQVAAALGVEALADELITELEAKISAKEEEVQTLIPDDESKLPRVAFLYVRGTAGIYYLFGEGSSAEGLFDSLGVIDVAEEIGWVGEKPMTDEALIAANPDVILVMTGGLESAGGVDGLLEAQPSIALTNAGKNRRIIDAADSVIFSGGTRIPDVIDGLARAIYAPESLEVE